MYMYWFVYNILSQSVLGKVVEVFQFSLKWETFGHRLTWRYT